MVVRDVAHPSRSASFVRDVAELFLVSVPITEQTLVDVRAVTRGVSMPFAPLTVLVVLFRAMFPSIRKVVEAGIEHGLWDIRGRRGIMEDAWLEAVESISASKGSQGVLFFPARVIIEFLEVSQVFSQVSDLIVGFAEALYFGAEGLISFLLDGKIDHQREGFPGEESVCLLTSEDSSGVGVFPRSKGA
jgi:hypothetical protein